MVSKKSSRKIAAIATLLTFLSIVCITACTKQGANKYSCEGVVCLNGGYCDSSKCVCPTGFEGGNCSIPSAQKYIGTWNVRQIVVGSDSASHINDTTYYTAFLKNSATPTTFFIDNFNGDPYYNQVVCTIDTPILSNPMLDNTNGFIIDTISGYSMVYGHYQLKYGSGSIDGTTDTIITGQYVVRHTNTTVNWETDTVNFILTPHHL